MITSPVAVVAQPRKFFVSSSVVNPDLYNSNVVVGIPSNCFNFLNKLSTNAFLMSILCVIGSLFLFALVS